MAIVINWGSYSIPVVRTISLRSRCQENWLREISLFPHAALGSKAPFKRRWTLHLCSSHDHFARYETHAHRSLVLTRFRRCVSRRPGHKVRRIIDVVVFVIVDDVFVEVAFIFETVMPPCRLQGFGVRSTLAAPDTSPSSPFTIDAQPAAWYSLRHYNILNCHPLSKIAAQSSYSSAMFYVTVNATYSVNCVRPFRSSQRPRHSAEGDRVLKPRLRYTS